MVKGDAYQALGQLADATTAYQQATEAEPSNFNAWTALGNMYRRTYQPRRAVNA